MNIADDVTANHCWTTKNTNAGLPPRCLTIHGNKHFSPRALSATVSEFNMSDISKPSSVRADTDSWNITESVGITALGVAACRAIETNRADALIRDEFALVLVSAAGPQWAQMATGNLGWQPDDDLSRREFHSAVDYQAVRTHFFDTYFTAAAEAGIKQAVILAAGLDSRAFRLDWPPESVVFEIDRPEVLNYKTATLAEHAAVPRTTYRPVGIDLREDWAAALVAAGFDQDQPTTWLAEGLLPYLPADAQERLFDVITQLSAPDSRIAIEAFELGGGSLTALHGREGQQQVREQMGAGATGVAGMLYNEADRASAESLLAQRDWQVNSIKSQDEMERLGRPTPPGLTGAAVVSDLITARRYL
jgi:methyltransferase (TIGR00027 family)